MSESPGRNASERTGGPEIIKPRRPSPHQQGEGSMRRRNPDEAKARSGGVLTVVPASAETRNQYFFYSIFFYILAEKQPCRVEPGSKVRIIKGLDA